jgi:hypothetical protein
MAGEQLANNVSVWLGNGATPTEVFAVIPGVVGIPTIPSPVRDEIEVTALDSTAKEFILGLADNGEVTMTLNLRRKTTGSGYLAVQEQLEGYANDGLPHNFQVRIVGQVQLQYAFAALVKSFRPQAPSANSALTAECTIRVTGAVTRTTLP